MASSTSLTIRAVLALVLLVGFYVMAIVIALGMLYLCYAMVAHAHRVNGKALVFLLFGACAILWSLVPRFDRFEAPGPELLPHEHPRLFGELEGIAQAVNQRMPAEVYLVSGVNAWVSTRGGIMGIGSRRVMGLGLPLLQCLSVTQLRAVLAHEFGHYHGGDTSLGPVIYQTRAAIGRTLQNIGDSILQWPFRVYGNMFLRVTHAVSRHQEFAADALAAETVGSAPLISGLKTVHAAGAAFDPYWQSELAPVLGAGFLPPCGEGFSLFLKSKPVEAQVRKMIDHELQSADANPYDTHPPLRERIAAAQEFPSGAVLAYDPASATLLEDLPNLETAWLSSMFGQQNVAGLERVSWQELGDRVYIPSWEKMLREHAVAFDGVHFGDLPRLAQSMDEFSMSLSRALNQFLSKEEAAGRVGGIVGAALGLVLHDHGWQLETGPGLPIAFRRGDREIVPFDQFSKLMDKSMSDESWISLCDELSIRDNAVCSVGDEPAEVG
jgi:Zn-dependent protease with chaperone function